MVRIRLTYQEPDETEVHDISENDSTGKSFRPPPCEKSLLQEKLQQESKELLVPAPSPPRRNSSLIVPPQANLSGTQPRKFSFPATLPSAFLGLESTGVGVSARRRFSNVSDAVTRKLSHTIGWRSSQVHYREIVEVGKNLCSQYIRTRLRRAGYLNKKCGLQRLKSTVSFAGNLVFREVYPELLAIGLELERMHPKLYTNVSRQASSAPGGKLSSDKEACDVLTAVSRELLKNDLTWGKVISLYAVCAGLAVDCVRQGHHDYLFSLVDAMEEILEDELAHWIQCKGGWCALAALVKPPNSNWSFAKVFAFITPLFSIILFVFFLLHYFDDPLMLK